MLHVTNGDIAAGLIRRAGFSGQVIAWRDLLYEGPVRPGLALEALSDQRALFIASCGWGTHTDLLRQFGARDAALRSARNVVLWFEHDLSDQLQLLQILAILAEHRETRAGLICIDGFPGVEPFHGLGQLTAPQLATLWPQRRPVTAAQLALAARGWKAFSSNDRLALTTFLGSDLSALPFLGPALSRLLEEYPAPPLGLSRTECQILTAVAAGHQCVEEVFRTSQLQEDAPFMSDTAFQRHLDALALAPTPLVTRPPLQLTDVGHRVLAGEVDHRDLNGCDRWIGGVHLTR